MRRIVAVAIVAATLGALGTACSVPIRVRRMDPRTVHRALTSDELSSGCGARFGYVHELARYCSFLTPERHAAGIRCAATSRLSMPSGVSIR